MAAPGRSLPALPFPCPLSGRLPVFLSLLSSMSLPTFDQDLAAVDSGSPQPPSMTAAMPPPVNNLRLVFNGDILLLALFACVVVLSMPRAFARLASGWHQGHILRSVSTDNKRSRKTTNATYSGNGMDMKSDVSHTYYSHTNLVQHEKGRASPAFPHHVPTVSSTLHPIAALLRRRIVPGFSIGQALILALYSGILHYLSLYNSNIFTDPDRTGFVAMSQIPVVFAFATKNNLLGTLIGFGYEKVRAIFLNGQESTFKIVSVDQLPSPFRRSCPHGSCQYPCHRIWLVTLVQVMNFF